MHVTQLLYATVKKFQYIYVRRHPGHNVEKSKHAALSLRKLGTLSVHEAWTGRLPGRKQLRTYLKRAEMQIVIVIALALDHSLPYRAMCFSGGLLTMTE